MKQTKQEKVTSEKTKVRLTKAVQIGEKFFPKWDYEFDWEILEELKKLKSVEIL